MATILMLFYLLAASSSQSINQPAVLPILVLVPFPATNHEGIIWDRGLDLLPAARVAAKEINSRDDMLVGYEIQLIEASSDDCGVSLTTAKSLTNFAWNSLSRSTNLKAMAVTGLVCSSVTSSISQLAGRPEVDLIQVAMAYSSHLRNETNYRRLWRILPSNLIFVNATLSLLNKFGVSRASVVYNFLEVSYQNIAESLTDSFAASDIMQLLNIGIESGEAFLDVGLDHIKQKTARIIVVAGVNLQLICKAAEKNLVWPGYIWIMIVEVDIIKEILRSSYCGHGTTVKALENAIIITLQLNNSRSLSDILVSGKNLSEYYQLYEQEIEKLKSEEFVQQYLASGYTIKPNDYANPMYDEVWALSLALNASLPDLDRLNLSLKHYQYNMSSITDIVESHLQNVHFSGVTGNIAFNSYRETHVPVLLYQIRNGSEVLIGKYSGLDDNFTLLNNSPINFPNDTFDIRYSLIPLPVAILFYTSSGIISIFITLTLILMFTVVYNEPEVKATSPWLTILIFIGGYFNITSSILLITHQSWLFDEAPYLVLCTISSWLAYCGINLINVTVLVKLVRVYRVFTHFGRMKKIWRNKYLFFVILGLAMIVPTVVTAITAIADPYKYEKIDNFMYNTNPPINLICLDCAQNLISTSVIIAYTITIVLFLISFAVLTRKVDRKDFKDTKKILAFVFILTISVGTLLPIVIIFEKFKNANLSNIFLSILIQFETVISVGMLVMPKVYGALYRRAELKSVKKIQDSIKNTTTTIINLSPIKRPVNNRD